MKIVIAYKATDSRNTTGMNILVWPDSAMIRSGKPFFLPEGEMCLITGFVAKINGVGKTIRQKFAGRYFNEIAPAALILTISTARQIVNRENPLACDIISDYSVICGNFIPVPQTALSFNVDIRPLHRTKSSNDTIAESCEFIELKGLESYICDAIATGSLRNTLKTGDLAGFVIPKLYPVSSESFLRVTVDGQHLIENKLK